jgi:hypothetical protein
MKTKILLIKIKNDCYDHFLYLCCKEQSNIMLKKIFFTILFSTFVITISAQDLRNPRLTSYDSGSSYSSGNYFLFIDPGKNIKPTDISLDDFNKMMNNIKETKAINDVQQRMLDEQKREIENLKKLTSELQRQLDEQKRKLENLERIVK